MVDEDGPGAILSLEEVQALGSVEEATPVVISDSRINQVGGWAGVIDDKSGVYRLLDDPSQMVEVDMDPYHLGTEFESDLDIDGFAAAMLQALSRISE